ncbi:MAG: insulinase family protein [Candidatus Omnitrophica bacterium]|nr:insulinase family protein [Candidatus Omnitrophota bacterium]
MKKALILAVVASLTVCLPNFASFAVEIPDRNIEKEVLDNGLTVVALRESGQPLVTIRLMLAAGLSSEGEYLGTGISHFIEHMAFQGTVKRSSGAVEKEVKSYGGTINASTSLDSVSVYITIPKEHFRKALELVSDIVFNPSYPAKEAQIEKEVILKEIRMQNDDPSWVVMSALWENAFLDHPYQYPIIGYTELFKNITREDLVLYHGRRYFPQNMIVAIAGDVDPKEALDEARSIFGKHARKRAYESVVPVEQAQITPREIINYKDINLGYLAMGFHAVSFSHDDMFALDVLSTILGSGDGSVLNTKIVKEKRLLHAVSAYNYTPKFPGLFIIYGIGDPGKINAAKETMLKTIESVKSEGVSDEELSRARNLAKTAYINSMETTGGLSRAMAQGEFFAGDASFFRKYLDYLDRVDNESIKTVARKYLVESNLTVSHLFPLSFVSPEAANKNEKESTHRARLETLPNGIRVILKEDSKLPKIALVAVLPGGLRAENVTTNGISNLTARMLLKGTSQRSEAEIAPMIESLGGVIQSFSGLNTFGVSAEFLKEDSVLALDIVSDILKNAAFPREELVKEKEKIYAAIKAENDDIYDTAFLKTRTGLFGDYPYGLRAIGEEESVKSLTRENLAAFYKKYCISDHMVIALVGDFRAEKMLHDISELFRDMPRGAVALNVKPLPTLTGEKEIIQTMKRAQSLAVIGMRGTTLKNSDRYALALLCSVLSGENGRLYESARNRLGLSYTQGAFSVPGVDTGYILAYIATNEKNISIAKEVLLSEFEKIRKGKISANEIKLSKNSLLGRHLMSMERFASLAYIMALDEFYEIGYDNYMQYPSIIKAITDDEALSAARKYLDPKNSVICVIAGQDK